MSNMRVVEFRAPGPLLNMNRSMHWARKAELVKAWRLASQIAARLHRLEPQPFSIITADLPVRSLSVRRDPHNFYPTLKAIIDGLVDAGVWPDDSARFLATSEPSFHVGPDVRVLISPAAGPEDAA